MIRLRIELEDIKPPIWREFVVPASISLEVLHEVIQGVMGWQNYHLQSFEIAGKRYELPDEDGWGVEEGYLDQREFTLGELVSESDEFSYTYDYGDNWKHKLTVLERKKVEGSPDTVFPTVLDGQRACPPEDCGGPYRYPEFLEELGDPDNPEHESTKEWAGPFDPEIFSITQAHAYAGAMYVWALEKRLRYIKAQ
jgi:hypothetical protein